MITKLLRGSALAIVAMAAIPGYALELTTNGGFETGDFTGWTQFPSGAGQQFVSNVNPGLGVFSGEINNDLVTSNSLFKQANIGKGLVTAGMPVTISFDARGSYASPGGVAFAELFSEIDGGGVSKSVILGGAPLSININPGVWTHFVFQSTLGANVSGGVTLQLGATNSPDAAGTHMWYDNASVTVVPEPATVAALSLGLIAILKRRRA